MSIVINRVPECDTCDAYCCKYFILPVKIDSKFLPDYQKWLELHTGVKVIFHKGRNIMKIPITCKELDGNRCKLFNTEERPIMCNAGDCPKKDKEYIEKIEKISTV